MARPLVRDYAAKPEHSLVSLSKELAKKVGRPRPWNHAALVRFVANGQCSADLAAAISAFFKLPRPAFVARSLKEAWAMEATASEHDNTPTLSPVDQEIIELEERLEAKRRQAEDEAKRAAAREQRAPRPRQPRRRSAGT